MYLSSQTKLLCFFVDSWVELSNPPTDFLLFQLTVRQFVVDGISATFWRIRRIPSNRNAMGYFIKTQYHCTLFARYSWALTGAIIAGRRVTGFCPSAVFIIRRLGSFRQSCSADAPVRPTRQRSHWMHPFAYLTLTKRSIIWLANSAVRASSRPEITASPWVSTFYDAQSKTDALTRRAGEPNCERNNTWEPCTETPAGIFRPTCPPTPFITEQPE